MRLRSRPSARARAHASSRLCTTAAWLVVALLLATVGAVRNAHAHGGPVKVVDDLYSVTAILSPAGEATQIEFFVSEFLTGRAPQEPMSFRIRVVDDESNASVCTGPPGVLDGGSARARCRVPRDGFYEVFLEFWSDRAPERVHAPEDWLVWIGEPGIGRGPTTLLVLAAALTTVSMGVSVWRRRGAARKDDR